ncbi:MAG TPA: dihydroorotate dehydrogenase electron transfer subunit [Treponemataceae bacterium]|nr:dihydroorotate dehydrogenase electron transfer subunit [Treponemataceae bacterium]
MSPCADHDPFPRVASSARVAANREIAPGVFELVCDRALPGSSGRIPAPVPGQFFMLRARPSGVLLGRPISVYRSGDDSITFLILRKGAGSAELCGLRAGDALDLVGPIGNRFVPPAELCVGGLPGFTERAMRVALVGGGIGVAPIAGFSFGLAAKSFDFYASYRSAPYGLDGIEARAAKVSITTEDGSAGVKGMLPAVFDAGAYDLVYACGPTPMLRYVQKACADARAASGHAASDTAASPIAFLSLEEHMACGAGACLGCTVRTTGGNRRCCVDGPVFNGAEVIL